MMGSRTTADALRAEQWRSAVEAESDAFSLESDEMCVTWHILNRRSPIGAAVCGMALGGDQRATYDSEHWRRVDASGEACWECSAFGAP